MTDVLVPKLSMAMEEAAIVEWLVSDSADVSVDDPIVTLETDKSTVDVCAEAAGRISLLARAGDIVPVNSLIARILTAGEVAEPMAQVDPSPALPLDRHETAPEPTRSFPSAVPESSGRVAISPIARKLARENGIDVATIAGSGPGGRVLESDVRQLISTAAAPSPAPLGDVRKAVVANLTASWSQIPHINIGGDISANGLHSARKAIVGRSPKLTVSDLLIFAVAHALVEVPELAGGAAGSSPSIHLALAVAAPGGVVAPVLRGADQLSLEEIALERSRLVSAARSGSLEARELGGANCTLSNLGAHPVDFFTPVISGPQVSLIAIGRLREVPVASNGMLSTGFAMWVNASLDHRAIDGEAGGRFLAALENQISELPNRLATN